MIETGGCSTVRLKAVKPLDLFPVHRQKSLPAGIAHQGIGKFRAAVPLVLNICIRKTKEMAEFMEDSPRINVSKGQPDLAGPMVSVGSSLELALLVKLLPEMHKSIRIRGAG
jgi:hypothetical protein